MKTAALVAVAALLPMSTVAGAAEIELLDPAGDDKGHGSLVYPTHKVYKPGSFDLRSVEIEADGSTITVTAEFATKIEDPWDSKSWDGNGFSLQFVQIYIDKDRKAGAGHVAALPGMNVDFKETARWEKVLLISPQPNNRLKSEIGQKSDAVRKDIVLPKKVKVRGKKLVATFKTKDVGKWGPGWGVQALVQSNEGYPAKEDLLTRKVNEYEGEHRFGGGHDYDCDPHVIDMLAGSAQGNDAEAKAQFSALATFSCAADGTGSRAKIDMVYPK